GFAFELRLTDFLEIVVLIIGFFHKVGFSQRTIRVANPRKDIKPTTSLMVVSATLPARAGSIPRAFINIGSTAPASMANVILMRMAIAMTSEINGSRNHRNVIPEMTRARNVP